MRMRLSLLDVVCAFLAVVGLFFFARASFFGGSLAGRALFSAVAAVVGACVPISAREWADKHGETKFEMYGRVVIGMAALYLFLWLMFD